MPIRPEDLRTGGALHGAVAASLVKQREAGAELQTGARVGMYRVVREIGRGGMAVVYLAERADGEYEQQVALKWMQGAHAAGTVAETLFRRERQALANLRHPHIARLLDGGRTAEGRPWFAMEDIAGDRIDRHASAQAMAVTQRLALFRQVCEAVAFAHARGILHRDIKPSNVLVDADGRAKLLDFGIALLLGEDDALVSRACTPGFASPEQLRGEPPTVVSDVYQLGRVLAALLSADARESDALLADEATRVTAWLDRAATGTGSAALPAGLPRDLSAILRKASALDPAGRYATVDALAEDVRAFLERRPVSARPRSAGYVTQRFVQRHPITAVLAAFALLQLIGGGIAIGLQVQQTRLARDQAVARAGELENVARFQASQLAAIDTRQMGVQLRQSLIEGAPEPQRPALDAALAGVNFTSVSLQALDANIFTGALKAIERDFAGQPQVKASLLQTLATTTRALGLLDSAAIPQQQALAIRRAELGETHPDTLRSRDEYGELLLQRRQLAEAEAEFRDALPAAQAVLGATDDTTLDLATGLALALQGQGKLAEAEAPFREVLAQRRRHFGDGDHDTLSAMNNLGNLLQEMGRYEEAEPLLQEAIAERRRVFAEGHPSTSIALVNLGGMYLRQRNHGEGERVLREAVDLLRRHQGDNHHLTLSAANNLGTALQMQNKLEEAEFWTRMAMDGRRQTLGEHNKDTLSAVSAYAVLLTKQGRAAEAERLQRRVLETARATLGPDDYLLGIYATGLGRTLVTLARWTEAEKALLDARETFARGVGLDFPYAQRNREALVELYEAWDRAEPDNGHAAKAARWREEPQAPPRPAS